MSDDGVLRELTKTKEMTLAWGFRGALALIMTLSGIVGWMAWDKLDVVSKQVGQGSIEFQKLSVTVQSTFAKYDETRIMRDDQIKQISTELGDHENRIRTLERK